MSIALKDRSYADIYQHMVELGAYNAKMLDGALIQMMYMFRNQQLQSHRLAFFPSPNLEEFQNNPDIYLADELYADIVAKNIVSFPIRFDYEASERMFRQLEHPKSHMTLGQYEHCRIPVTAPVTPYRFIEFIVRNFYHTGFRKYADRLPVFGNSFPESISESERNVLHVAVPVEGVTVTPDNDGVQGIAPPPVIKAAFLGGGSIKQVGAGSCVERGLRGGCTSRDPLDTNHCAWDGVCGIAYGCGDHGRLADVRGAAGGGVEFGAGEHFGLAASFWIGLAVSR